MMPSGLINRCGLINCRSLRIISVSVVCCVYAVHSCPDRSYLPACPPPHVTRDAAHRPPRTIPIRLSSAALRPSRPPTLHLAMPAMPSNSPTFDQPCPQPPARPCRPHCPQEREATTHSSKLVYMQSIGVQPRLQCKCLPDAQVVRRLRYRHSPRGHLPTRLPQLPLNYQAKRIVPFAALRYGPLARQVLQLRLGLFAE